MKRFGIVLVLAIGGALATGLDLGGSEPKPTPPPFYRQYLVPGNPLDDKIAEQEKRVEASPQDANLRNDFGNLLAERRFPEQAAEQYETALELDKKNFISAYNLGLVRETEGKVSSAISAYQRSIKRKPGFPQSRFRLGRLYEKTNQPESAVHEYAAAMWIDPAMRDPKRNPLIIDCQLIYLASLANYGRDVAVASMTESEVYFDNDRFRKLPTNRAISSKEVEVEEEPAPRDVGSPGSAGSAGAGAAGAPVGAPASASEPARRGPRTPPPGSGPRPVPPNLRRTPPQPRAQGTPVTGAPAPQTTPPPGETAEPAPAPPESAPEPAVTPGPPQEVEPS
jgi:hypothetical protein